MSHYAARHQSLSQVMSIAQRGCGSDTSDYLYATSVYHSVLFPCTLGGGCCPTCQEVALCPGAASPEVANCACRSGSGGQQVELLLSGGEASDYINFVVKDSSSGTWYDREGTNYHIPLTGSVATMSIDEQIPDAELPDLPGELCGIWSYIKWEQAGCPNRTEQDSQAAYREAIKVRPHYAL